MYSGAEMPKEAQAYAERAIRADITCGSCFATLGDILEKQGKIHEALDAVRTALSLLRHGERNNGLEVKCEALKAKVH